MYLANNVTVELANGCTVLGTTDQRQKSGESPSAPAAIPAARRCAVPIQTARCTAASVAAPNTDEAAATRQGIVPIGIVVQSEAHSSKRG